MIGIILFFIIIFYLFKAVLSTIHGLLLIGLGVCCFALAQFLRVIALILDLIEKSRARKSRLA